MKCMDYINLLSDYLDEDIEKKEREQLEEHINECEECRHFFESFRSSVGVFKEMEAKPCPPGLEAKLKAIVESKIKNKNKPGEA